MLVRGPYSSAHRAALEPRVEQLGAELAEARAEAKVARAESEHLRRAGDEARDRSAATDAERSSAQVRFLSACRRRRA